MKMTSFLTRERTNESFEQRISTEPSGTQLCKKYAVKIFGDFVVERYPGKTIADIVDELNLIKSTQNQQTYEEALYGILQDWINWNENRGLGNYTIRISFSNLRKFLFHLGIKTNEQDIKEYLRFGKRVKEERHPLSDKEYRDIVLGFSRNPTMQLFLLMLGSSGMRMGEALKLKKKDLDLSKQRIKVNIPADTKTRTGRSTYISNEAKEKLDPILEKISPDDYIFGKNGRVPHIHNFTRALIRTLDKMGMSEKYQSNSIRKISTHSFRAYFFTKAARKHGENYAHKMVGHGGYLMQYDRMTEDEKLTMYIELEPELVVFDQTRNELEIKKLKQDNESIEQLRDEVRKLRENQAKQDKKMLDEMRRDGIISN
jgi:integrase